MTRRERDHAMAMLAQAVINIQSGLATIEKDSPIYNAMALLVREYADREV